MQFGTSLKIKLIHPSQNKKYKIHKSQYCDASQSANISFNLTTNMILQVEHYFQNYSAFKILVDS